MSATKADLYVKSRAIMDALVDCLYRNCNDQRSVSAISRIILLNLVNCEIKDADKAEAVLQAIDAAYDAEASEATEGKPSDEPVE